jgi:hypothetical protein
MTLPKYQKSNATSKSGVNHVRSIVESNNSIFHEIHQENDIGIDAYIELIDGEYPTCKMIAVQIKSGESFFINERCEIPIDNHRSYWENHQLPVYGIVYIPSLATAFWVDIKHKLKTTKETKIKYSPTKINEFNDKDFRRIFLPSILKQHPKDFSFDEAKDLLSSDIYEETYLGLNVLFREYSDRNETWLEFYNFFRNKPIDDIPPIFPYFLAHIPWHGDIFGGRDKITSESRDYAKNIFCRFDKDDYVKLLKFIDENGITRGSIGQNIEAIISSIEGSVDLLSNIIKDESLDIEIRENSAIIYACQLQEASLPLLKSIASESYVASTVIQHIEEYGGINPYE